MRSRNVCLTPELGADPGRVKDRIGGWRKEETGERQSPLSAPERGKGGSAEEEWAFSSHLRVKRP